MLLPLIALLLPGAAAYGVAAPHVMATAPHTVSTAPRVVSPRLQLGDMKQTAGAVTAATAVIEEVSRSVSSKGVEAPDTARTFVSMDADRAGLVDEDGLPLVYDKAAIQKYWETQGGALQQRWIEFLGVAVPFITRVAGLLIQGGTEALEKEAASLARDARISIEKLGPTYIKLGQTLSVRPDVLPQAALDELAVLQDNVEGFPTATAIAMVEKEYGRPLMEVFSEFSDEPVAAASLAQVYKATLRSTGEEVAVKVQRPGCQTLVSKDLYVLRRAAEVYQGLVTRFAPQQRTNYVALLNEWAVGFYTELDFKNEGRNMEKMRILLGEQMVQDVLVPRVFDEYSTQRVLVSQWVDGIKLSMCEPGEIKELIAVGQECFLVQLLQVGFFHSDPHPGNLLRLNDQSEYKLALIDFGLVAQVEQKDMDSIISAVIHLANKDYAALVDDFIALEILPSDCNRQKVIPLMDKALTPYVKGGGAKRYESELKSMYGMEENMVGGFQAMTQDMLTVLNDIPFSIPPYFALLARAVVTLEGLALTADPDYGLIIEAYPFVARKLLSEGRPELQQALQQVLYTPAVGEARGVVTPTRLASLINSAAGIVAKESGAVFVDLDAIPEDGLSATQAATFLLSDNAASIRQLLSTEAATAADLLLRQALRKSLPSFVGSLPSLPQLPFLPPPPDPLATAGPFLLPPLNGAPARPLWISPNDLLDAIAPGLTREEELYAIALVDLARSSFGEDAAAVAAGDLVTNPLSAVRLLLNAVAAADADGLRAGVGDSNPASSVLTPELAEQLVAGAKQLRDALPGASAEAPASGSAVDSASGEQLEELAAAITTLSASEEAALREVVDEVSNTVLGRLGERAKALSS